LGLKPDTECAGCFRRGFEDYVLRAGLKKADLERYMMLVERNLCMELPPPLAGAGSWTLLRSESNNGRDIFAREKADFTDRMLSVYGVLRDGFLASDNPAAEALSAATWCNLLDVGQGRPLPGIEELMELFGRRLASDERAGFLSRLHEADTLLILGDNAGETVMDRLFLELSGFRGERYYMTRTEPVMNDALLEDAVSAGLHEEAVLIASGTDIPSVVPELLRGEPLDVFRRADLILAKGQGNLEGLFGLGDPRIYHSFVVKCPVVSRAAGAPVGEGVFRRFTDREV